MYKELEKVKKQLVDMGYNVLGIGVYGSQNYNMHDKDGDIDMRVVVMLKRNHNSCIDSDVYTDAYLKSFINSCNDIIGKDYQYNFVNVDNEILEIINNYCKEELSGR